MPADPISPSARAARPAEPAPVSGGDRIDVLDVLRGVAIFGILLFNIEVLSGYEFLSPAERETLPRSGLDGAASFFIYFLVRGKFYSIFSFLFGVGFAVFIARAAAKGGDAVGLFRRRLTGLLVIGLAHALFLWYGDILVLYALLGFVLIPLRRLSDRALLATGIALLAAPPLLYGALMLVSPESTGSTDLPPFLMRAVESFRSGSYPEVVMGNATFTAALWVRRVVEMQIPRVLGMFVLGYWAGRAGIFADVPRWAPRFRTALVAGLVVGLPLEAISATLSSPVVPNAEGWIRATVDTIGMPALAAAYVSGITLLFQSPRWRARLMPIAAVGRTALSNYLLQSFLGVLIFWGVGFGLFGRLPLSIVLLMGVVIFAAQVGLSLFWTRRFRYGPVERLWRDFTYAGARRTAAAAAPAPPA